MKKVILLVLMTMGTLGMSSSYACTGITLRTSDSLMVTARTIEWAIEPLRSMYVVVPRGKKLQSQLPKTDARGMRWNALYGYVGIAVEDEFFVMEGINEAGLSAGLFYFPEYGKYVPYDSDMRSNTISDMQFVSWVLSMFATIDELIEGLGDIRVVGIDPRASTVHWRVSDVSGRQVVIEIVDEEVMIYDNPLGVLTNSPEFSWHITNLNNYVNLMSGSVRQRSIGRLHLQAFGGGSGLHGLPGDMTPPSRFVRAAFYQSTAPILDCPSETVIQAFHLLNNFDIPIGIQFSDANLVPEMPSATQITIVTDLHSRRLYYRTMYNASIRCIDLDRIDFDRVRYQVEALEIEHDEPIEMIEIY